MVVSWRLKYFSTPLNFYFFFLLFCFFRLWQLGNGGRRGPKAEPERAPPHVYIPRDTCPTRPTHKHSHATDEQTCRRRVKRRRPKVPTPCSRRRPIFRSRPSFSARSKRPGARTQNCQVINSL